MQRIRYSKYIKPTLIALDILVILASYFFFFGYNHYINHERTGIDLERNITISFLLVVIWVLISGKTSIYNLSRNIGVSLYIERLINQFVAFGFTYLLVGKIGQSFIFAEHRFNILAAIFVQVFIIKILIFVLLKYYRSLGKNHRNVMIINENETTDVLKNIIQERKNYGYKFFEFSMKNDEIDLDQLVGFWTLNGIHTLFIPMDFKNNSIYFKKIVENAEKHSVNIRIIPDIIRNDFFLYELKYIENFPILSPVKFPLDHFINQFIKRVFDVVFSLLVLVFIASWLFPIIALLLYIDNKGPVFFRQERYGYLNQKFVCYKFRTMIINEDSDTKTTLPNDYRITRFGHFLRKKSLDELPQFYNVLIGEMSCVGPRPHMLAVDDKYKYEIQRYGVRSMVKPGLTGLSQTNGLRGEKEEMNAVMKDRVLSDAYYVKNWSMSLDIVIIIKTVFLMIYGDENAL